MQRVQNEKVCSERGEDNGVGPPVGAHFSILLVATTMMMTITSNGFPVILSRTAILLVRCAIQIFPDLLASVLCRCLVFQIPPRPHYHMPVTLPDVFHALPHLTFTVNVVIFEAGPISVFLVKNIE